MVLSTGIISTFAGTGPQSGGSMSGGLYNGDGNLATSTSFYNPQSLAVDSSGNIYVSDLGNNRIRKIITDGSNGQRY